MPETEHTTDHRHSPKRLKKREPLSLSAFFISLFAFLGSFSDQLWHRIRRIGPRFRALRREHKAGNFPESDRRLIQFFLLIPGLLSMWKALLKERLFRRRGERLRFTTSLASYAPQGRRIHPVAFVTAALLIAALAAFLSIYTPATTILYKGEPLETVLDGAEAHKIAAKVEHLTAETLGNAFTFEADSIQYSTGLVRRSDLDQIDDLEQALTNEIGLVTYGYSLYIDGTLIGSTQYEGALEALLEQVQQISVSADTLSVDFIETAEIVPGYVPTDSLVNLGHIAETINSTKVDEVTYTVVSGDTWSKIAARNDMSNEDLLALNPGFDVNKIHVGDELVLSKEIPYLTVTVTERQNYVEEVNYDIVYQDDSSMYQGDTRIIEKGAFGSADVVADVVYVNGVETERTVISQVMLTAPKTETRARGTKERPSWMPTGNFRWPCSGRISSYFGYRNTGIRGASTYHQGIDIACAYGTTIVAADGGTVEYTGYKGAMGYTVIINHGNGYKTYYEHCSTFACKTGQHVYKGQAIAYVGRSGVTSGAHCHFGIQKNGTYVNPMKYLR